MSIEEYKREIERMLEKIHNIRQMQWIYNIVCVSYEKMIKQEKQ